MKLFDSPFSPFARKVRMALQYKDLQFEAVDALQRANHAQLQAVNGRVEVPTLVDGDTIVVNSADIVCYLEHQYPDQPLYPAAPHTRVHARAWERAADTLIDPILVDISYWRWAKRSDTMPAGLLEAARADLARVYDALEAELAQRAFVSTDDVPSIADSDIERDKIFWRGDRIEWLLARGFHEWFAEEIRAQRVIWPGTALPASLTHRPNLAS